MAIELTKQQINAAMPKVAKGLEQYVWIQSQVTGPGQFHTSSVFRKKFNHFYRVRRAVSWQDAYYNLMAQAKRDKLQFPVVLELLHKETNRYEASFASKLVATVNPSNPVIDSMVLKNLGLRLPYSTAPNRASDISILYQELTSLFASFLMSENGIYLVSQFKLTYPKAKITDEKMLDLVLWQTRG